MASASEALNSMSAVAARAKAKTPTVVGKISSTAQPVIGP
jgi:hypothetical protein